MFKLWSETNPQAKKMLKLDLGLRSWDDLSEEDKDKIWHYMNWYFFSRQIREKYDGYGGKSRYYEFNGEYKEVENKRNTVLMTIAYLNENYKAQTYAKKFLENPSLNTACFY